MFIMLTFKKYFHLEHINVSKTREEDLVAVRLGMLLFYKSFLQEEDFMMALLRMPSPLSSPQYPTLFPA